MVGRRRSIGRIHRRDGRRPVRLPHRELVRARRAERSHNRAEQDDEDDDGDYGCGDAENYDFGFGHLHV